MKPIDPRELMDEALLHARRLSKVLGMMKADALGVGHGLDTANHYKRDRHAASIAYLLVDLEEAKKKGVVG